jgi:ribosomal protein S18 acetylase RimI-like enzyme
MEKGVGIGRSDAPQEIEKKVLHDPDLFLVAEAGGVMVGTVIGGFDGRRGLIYHLAVAPSHRRRGLANRLMDEIEERLRSRGCLKCYLLVLEGNEEAAHFYEKRGWDRMDRVHLYGKELA